MSKRLLPLLLLLALGCSESSKSTYPVVTLSSASLSASALPFGSSPVGMTSATQAITLTATGGALGFNGVSITGANAGAFLASSSCPSVIALNASCAVTVAFAPTATGALSATLVITDSAGNSPQLVTLSGTGTASGPIASLSATSLTFTSLPVGQASTQTVTLSNIGSGSLTLYGFALGGANATSFALSGSCLTSGVLAANASCFLTVTYAPTIAGSLSATVSINDSAGNSPQTITLTSR